MSTLEHYNMVQKERNGEYQIGPKMFQLGMAYKSDSTIVDLAQPHLEDLMNKTGFTVHLGILHENHIMYIAKVEPNNFIKFSTYPGMITDVHLSGLGKAIAAYLSETELDDILEKSNFDKSTPKTITSTKEFKENLQFVREKGFSIEDEEGEIGVRCIGSAILNPRYITPIAVSITAHTSQLIQDQYTEVGELVREVAQKIARSI